MLAVAVPLFLFLLGMAIAKRFQSGAWQVWAACCAVVMGVHLLIVWAATLFGIGPSYSAADLILLRRFPMGALLFYAAYFGLFVCLGGLLRTKNRRHGTSS